MKMRKTVLAFTISAITLFSVLLLSSMVFALWPAGDGHPQGPALVGQWTFKPGIENPPDSGRVGVIFSFVGACADQEIEEIDNPYFADPNVSFLLYDEITEQTLLDNFIPYYVWVPEKCWPNVEYTDGMLIIKIKNYTDGSTQKVADVIMLWWVP